MIKKFFEFRSQNYDYKRIINIMHKQYGWGNGISNQILNFENNSDYFFDISNSDDYCIKFDIYLTDLVTDRLRGQLDKSQILRLGKWKLPPQVDSPISIYNKFT